MKDIKDYLHLYLGCECEYNWFGVEDDVPTGKRGRRVGTLDWMIIQDEDFEPKPILRPLSDMKDEEYTELLPLMPTDEAIDNDDEVQMFKTTGELNRWLLSRHFDLFGLIEDGLALDKTLFSDQIKVKI